MEFLKFFGFFLLSTVLLDLLIYCVNFFLKKRLVGKVKKALNNGDIKVVHMDDLVESITEEDGDGTWH